MDVNSRKDLAEKVRAALATEGLAEKMWDSTSRARDSRAKAIQELEVDIHTMKRDIRNSKVAAIHDSTLVEEFAARVKANGGEVFFARNGRDAIEYVAKLAKEKDADFLIKSKSLTSEEIEFNQGLAELGVRSIETDLGELIVQMANEKPVHLVFPAIHKSVQEVARLVSSKLGKSIPAVHDAILQEIRAYLRPIFLSSKIGVTGANVGIAETGTIVVETNEGNGRLTSCAPDAHVVLIGIEKIVPSWADVPRLIYGHTISASGQHTTVYVSCISAHSPLGGETKGRSFHVIILDNGRSKMKEDGRFSDALNCIRCGACMNICPTYSVVGGHTFGHIYPGPISIPWTSNIHGLDKAAYADLCISCGLCKEICPADINIPMMIAEVKQQQVDVSGQMRTNRFFMGSETIAKVSSATSPLSNWVTGFGPSRYLMEKLLGVDRRRTLPKFSRVRLRKRLEGIRQGDGSSGRVVYFPDIYADYNEPEIGVRAVRMLSALGYRVEVPDLNWSGMPFISYGEVRRATRVAGPNIRTLSRYVNEGYKIVATEPTATYVLREVYPKLMPGKETKDVAEQSYPFFAFIEPELGKLNLEATEPLEGEVGFHIPCHDRGLSNGRAAISFLNACGFKVRIVETGTCCGMGGTYGMKAGMLGYELSMAVGKNLFELFRESGCKVVATESSVCSTQIFDGTGFRVLHPLLMAGMVEASSGLKNA